VMWVETYSPTLVCVGDAGQIFSTVGWVCFYDELYRGDDAVACGRLAFVLQVDVGGRNRFRHRRWVI